MSSVDTLPDRLRSKIDASGPASCWVWTGAKTGNGYGNYYVSTNKWACAHTVVFEALVGPVPPDQELDHLCRVRRCVNPDHLEPVTHSENIARGNVGAFNRAKSACPKGHAFDDRNTRMYMGRRYCRACSRERKARRRKELLK